eukprot:758092-Hanusia_phi.AAC.5
MEAAAFFCLALHQPDQHTGTAAPHQICEPVRGEQDARRRLILQSLVQERMPDSHCGRVRRSGREEVLP